MASGEWKRSSQRPALGDFELRSLNAAHQPPIRIKPGCGIASGWAPASVRCPRNRTVVMKVSLKSKNPGTTISSRKNRISDPSWSDQLFGALTGFNGDDENPRPLEKNQFAGGQK